MKITYHEPTDIFLTDTTGIVPRSASWLVIGWNTPDEQAEAVYPIAVDHERNVVTVLRGVSV